MTFIKNPAFSKDGPSSVDPPARDFGPSWLVVLLSVLIFIISQFIAVLLMGAILDPHDAGDLTQRINNSPLAQFFYILLAEGLAVGLVFFTLRQRRLGLSSIGYGRRPKWADLRLAAGGFLVFYAMVFVATAIISAFIPNLTSQQQDVGFNSLHGQLDYLVAAAALIILPPLGEETLVRGYLFSGLRRRWRFVPAMLLTSALFGLAHLQGGEAGSLVWAASVDTFLLSVVLVYLRERTGALYAGILVHMANNLIAFLVQFHS